MARSNAKLEVVEGHVRDRTYGVRLAALLNERRMTLADLAGALDGLSAEPGGRSASRTALGLILKGTTQQPHKKTLDGIAAVLGADGDDVRLVRAFELLVERHVTGSGQSNVQGADQGPADDGASTERTAAAPDLLAAAVARYASGPPASPEDLKLFAWAARQLSLDTTGL